MHLVTENTVLVILKKETHKCNVSQFTNIETCFFVHLVTKLSFFVLFLFLFFHQRNVLSIANVKDTNF